MFNFGFFEIILLFIILVVFVGPEQLPSVAKNLLKLLNQWKGIAKKVQEPLDNIKEEITQKIKDSREVLSKDKDNISKDNPKDKY